MAIDNLGEEQVNGILQNTSLSIFELEIREQKIVRIENLLWNDVSHYA